MSTEDAPQGPGTGRDGRPTPPTGAGSAAPQGAPAAPVPTVVVQQQPHRRGWKIALIVAAVIVVAAIAAVSACSRLLTSGQQASAPHTVAIITLDGTIGYDGTSCSPEGLQELLDQAEDDANISAVVLRVNSGGGSSAAGEEMAQMVKDFSKPVVVSAASIDASAAYEISSQADYLYTDKSSEVGAIGTAMQVTDYSGLMEMLGISVDDIVSADSKDSSYGTRALTDEERAYYQKMVDQINAQFVQTVADGRHMSVSDAQALATGLPFTGLDAVDNGLFDAVGSLDDACTKASELAGNGNDYETMELSGSEDLDSLMDLLGESSQNSSDGDTITVSRSDLAKALKELKSNGILQ